MEAVLQYWPILIVLLGLVMSAGYYKRTLEELGRQVEGVSKKVDELNKSVNQVDSDLRLTMAGLADVQNDIQAAVTGSQPWHIERGPGGQVVDIRRRPRRGGG